MGDGGAYYVDMDRLVAFQRGMSTWANWVDLNINMNTTKVFFQSTSPTHYKYHLSLCVYMYIYIIPLGLRDVFKVKIKSDYFLQLIEFFNLIVSGFNLCLSNFHTFLSQGDKLGILNFSSAIWATNQ